MYLVSEVRAWGRNLSEKSRERTGLSVIHTLKLSLDVVGGGSCPRFLSGMRIQ